MFDSYSFSSLNLERVAAIKYLFGFENDASTADGFLDGSFKSVQELADLLGSEASDYVAFCFSLKFL